MENKTNESKNKNKIQKRWIESKSGEYIQDDIRVINSETGFNSLDCWEKQKNKWWKKPREINLHLSS